MINGGLIRKRRKELKMSQGELAEGITSQGMISQIETRSAVPSGETLEKIVTRLNMSFAEAVGTEEFIDGNSLVLSAVVRILHHQFDAASEILDKLDTLDDMTLELTLWRDYMRAWILAHSTTDHRSDAIFTYNRILQVTHHEIGVLWPLVASDLAVEYLIAGKVEPAKYYIDQAREAFADHDPEKQSYATLQLWTNASYYYLNMKQYDETLKITRKGIAMAQKEMISGPVDKLYINMAYALAGVNGKWIPEAIQALYMAYTFADHIHNDEVKERAVAELNAQGYAL
ncbi:hypothetical protein LPAF129_07600 [Ligilactobacillus pabuli]|uniref:HTH cro/C1-type domain-containing protein n=1 Tax=Ligilactobacillus pabuli TaxID=2886039 RepID=A0ABQ5JJH8_9LACO|nr:helix-turn-helix transcriptional regulator [Ligilactobacillus pabuli]GKS81075.1 hypothetical protein LPAF129_07600 [Ligilactobacillus pabuli]